MGVDVSFQISVLFSLNKYPEMKFLDHGVALFLIFWGNSTPFSIALLQFTILPTRQEGSFPPHPCHHSLSIWWQLLWEMKGSISLWFSFTFPWWLVLSICSHIYWPYVCLLWSASVFQKPIFQGNYNILHSHWQCIKVPVSLQPTTLATVFYTSDIPEGVQWHSSFWFAFP